MSYTVTVEQGQNLLDISVQETGTIENVFKIAQANDICITDYLPIGTVIIIPNDVVVNKKVKDYYKNKGIKPATNGS